MLRAQLDDDEAHEREHAEHTDRELLRTPALRRAFDQRVDDAREAERQRGSPRRRRWSGRRSDRATRARAGARMRAVFVSMMDLRIVGWWDSRARLNGQAGPLSQPEPISKR